MSKHECTLTTAVLPAPGPLPSLSSAFSRRAAIFGAVTVGAASAASLPALASTLAAKADAALIDLAGRTVALAQSHEEVEGQRNDAQAEIDRWDFANKPKVPKLSEPRSRMVATDLSTASHRVTQFAEIIEDGDAEEAAACIAYKEARQAHKRAVADRVAASGVPSLTKLSDSIWQDLIHAVEQLADMEPATLGGLAAKAAVIEVLAETDSDIADCWGQNLGRSIAEDVMRLHALSARA